MPLKKFLNFFRKKVDIRKENIDFDINELKASYVIKSSDDKKFVELNHLQKQFISAIKNNQYDSIGEILKQKGFSVNFFNQDGDTPLHIAVSCGYSDVVKILSKVRNTRFDIKNSQGMTPVILAAYYSSVCNNLDFNKYIEIIKILIDSGADAKIRDNNGKRFVDYITRGDLKSKFYDMSGLRDNPFARRRRY